MILFSYREPSVTPLFEECWNLTNYPTEQVNPTDSAWQPHKEKTT
jgi:hypothetical protein